MSTRKPALPDAYLDAWRELTPRTSRQRAEDAREDRLAELRQQAEFDALEPLNEYLDAYHQNPLDD